MERLTATQIDARGPKPGQSTANYIAELYAAAAVDKRLGIELPRPSERIAAGEAAGALAVSPAEVVISLPEQDILAEAVELADVRPALSYY